MLLCIGCIRSYTLGLGNEWGEGAVRITYCNWVLKKLLVCKKGFCSLFICKFVLLTSSRYDVCLDSGMKRFDLIRASLM